VNTSGSLDLSRCSTDFGTAEFFLENPLPKVGKETCFLLDTQDSFGNPVDVSSEVKMEVLAGVEDRVSNWTATQVAPGHLKLCFKPADADVVSVEVKIGDDESIISGFPIEVDCIPGDIVPNKTIVAGNGNIEAFAGMWEEIHLTTFDEADHVSNPDLSKTAITFDGPADVNYTIGLQSSLPPQTGVSVIQFKASIAGFYHAMVDIGGIVIGPLNITVRPGVSKLSQTVLVKSNVPIVAGQKNIFSIVTHDEFGNLIASGGLNLNIQINTVYPGSEGGSPVIKEITDHYDGTYSISWMTNRAGIYSINVSLPHEVSIFNISCLIHLEVRFLIFYFVLFLQIIISMNRMETPMLLSMAALLTLPWIQDQ
jgi:hypothetical protein